MSRSAVVIGAGFAGMAAATSLAQKGFSVTVIEKNSAPGGRARVWKERGFTFDMGPSFYWMPDVFSRYFERFGRRVQDLYTLVRLDPSYRMIFAKGDSWCLPAGPDAVARHFEQEERGASAELMKFLEEARMKYELGMNDLVYSPSLSWLEYIKPSILRSIPGNHLITSLRSHVHEHFKSTRIRQVMEFPALFLGASPQRTPALYSLMNYADIALGTWYPMGGMGRVVHVMERVARDEGVVLRTNENVTRVLVERSRAVGVHTDHGSMKADVVVASADYHHVEEELLLHGDRSYSPGYWKRRTLSPSVLMFYIGLDRRVTDVEHHTFFFDASLDDHSSAIHHRPLWPTKPLFHTCWPSRTDPSVAPVGCETLVVLIPIAAGLEDSEAMRERYFELVMERLREHLDIDLRPHVILQRSYCVDDLVADYNAYGGNAYGLAGTLRQTGPGRPRMKSRKVANLYFAGQLTVPGPGVPPALISGQVVADLIHKELRTA